VHVIQNIGEMFVPFFDSAVLNKGCSSDELQGLEKLIGQPIPESFRALYLTSDGEKSIQDGVRQSANILGGLRYLSISDVVNCYNDSQALLENEKSFFEKSNTVYNGYPGGAVKQYPMPLNPAWIPFAGDSYATHLALDLDPAEEGSVGQILLYGADIVPNIYVVAKSLDEFLSNLLSAYSKGMQHEVFGSEVESFIDTIESSYD